VRNVKVYHNGIPFNRSQRQHLLIPLDPAIIGGWRC
jgi:hypothetical protein